MIATLSLPPRFSRAPQSAHERLLAAARGLPNDEVFAQMIRARIAGEGVLPVRLGLGVFESARLCARHFPGVEFTMPTGIDGVDTSRAPEYEDLVALLDRYRAGRDKSEVWMARIVATACLGSDHLWQDLGLASREQLSRLMTVNFPALAAMNDRDMKWKKFLYKRLCEEEGIYTCRAPSCKVCVDYMRCFGPEE